MPTDGRILHSLVAVGLFATVMAWTGSAGNERASAASLPPPIVTKAIPLGTASKHAALHATSAVAQPEPAKPHDDNGTAAARQQNPATGQGTSEAPGPLMLQATPHDPKTAAPGASSQQAVTAPPSEPPATAVIGSNSPPRRKRHRQPPANPLCRRLSHFRRRPLGRPLRRHPPQANRTRLRPARGPSHKRLPAPPGAIPNASPAPQPPPEVAEPSAGKEEPTRS